MVPQATRRERTGARRFLHFYFFEKNENKIFNSIIRNDVHICLIFVTKGFQVGRMILDFNKIIAPSHFAIKLMILFIRVFCQLVNIKIANRKVKDSILIRKKTRIINKPVRTD